MPVSKGLSRSHFDSVSIQSRKLIENSLFFLTYHSFTIVDNENVDTIVSRVRLILDFIFSRAVLTGKSDFLAIRTGDLMVLLTFLILQSWLQGKVTSVLFTYYPVKIRFSFKLEHSILIDSFKGFDSHSVLIVSIGSIGTKLDLVKKADYRGFQNSLLFLRTFIGLRCIITSL